MYVCMYVCIYVLLYVCKYVCMYACMYVCMYVLLHVLLYVLMYLCMYYVYSCMYIFMHLCMHVCMYDLHVCAHVFMCIHSQRTDMASSKIFCSRSNASTWVLPATIATGAGPLFGMSLACWDESLCARVRSPSPPWVCALAFAGVLLVARLRSLGGSFGCKPYMYIHVCVRARVHACLCPDHHMHATCSNARFSCSAGSSVVR
jgi:hypothetical protein